MDKFIIVRNVEIVDWSDIGSDCHRSASAGSAGQDEKLAKELFALYVAKNPHTVLALYKGISLSAPQPAKITEVL